MTSLPRFTVPAWGEHREGEQRIYPTLTLPSRVQEHSLAQGILTVPTVLLTDRFLGWNKVISKSELSLTPLMPIPYVLSEDPHHQGNLQK